jgi:hydrogenase expression/formation protein HypE
VVEKLLPQDEIVALHNPTECGIATALHKLDNCGLQIEEDVIPILPETQKICTLFGLDPLGLLSSGALLIVCRAENEMAILTKLAGEPITQLGQFTTNNAERVLLKGDGLHALR